MVLIKNGDAQFDSSVNRRKLYFDKNLSEVLFKSAGDGVY